VLLCATAALLPPGYVLAGAGPLFLAWVWEAARARRWPWEPSAVDFPLAVWLALVAVSSALSPHRDLALPNTLLLALGPVAGLAPALRSFRERPPLLRSLAAAWALGGAVAGAWVVWRYLQTGAGRGDLPQLGWNAAGTVLASASLLALGPALAGGFRERIAVCAVQVPVLAGLVATLSRGAWMGWLAGLVCFAVLAGTRGRSWQVRVLALVAATVAVAAAHPPARARVLSTLDPQRNLDRILLWKATLRMVADHPWTGVGFGAFVREYPNYRLSGDPNTAPPFAHNLPLSLAAETGLLGLVAFLAFLVTVLRVGLQASVRAPPPAHGLATGAFSALVAILAQQLVDGTLQSFHLGFAFWILTAALLSVEEASKVRQEAP
jgi:putative inorganic carbon (HCO3(-)) transporter